MAWLLDTNVLSEIRRPAPSQRVTAFLSNRALDELYVSTVTLAEIRFGIHSALDTGRRADLEKWLSDQVRPMFSGRILEISENVMLRWRILVDDGRKVGHTFSQPDLLIAATALEHDMTLVTRNIKDFEGLGLNLSNPWEDL